MEPWFGLEWFTWTMGLFFTFPSLCPPRTVGTALLVLMAFKVLTQISLLSLQKPCGSCSADIQESGPCLAEICLSTSRQPRKMEKCWAFGIQVFLLLWKQDGWGRSSRNQIRLCRWAQELSYAQASAASFPRMVHRLSLRQLLHPFIWQCSWHWLKMTSHKIFF